MSEKQYYTAKNVPSAEKRTNLFNLINISRNCKYVSSYVCLVFQSMTKSSSPAREPPVKSETSRAEATPSTSVVTQDKAKDGSAHPHPGSDTRVREFEK